MVRQETQVVECDVPVLRVPCSARATKAISLDVTGDVEASRGSEVIASGTVCTWPTLG